MNLPDRIRNFLESRHVFVLATEQRGIPHACPLFYIANTADAALVFCSSESTRHAAEMCANPVVAGAVFADTRTVNEIHGVQFSGTIVPGASETWRAAYRTAFPEAQRIEAPFWTLELQAIKMTDNRQGFGHKEFWLR